jgi:hypothetical protein
LFQKFFGVIAIAIILIGGVWISRLSKEGITQVQQNNTIFTDDAKTNPDIFSVRCIDGIVMCSRREVLATLFLRQKLDLKKNDQNTIIKIPVSFNIKQKDILDLFTLLQKISADPESDIVPENLKRAVEVADFMQCSAVLEKLLVFKASSIQELEKKLKTIGDLDISNNEFLQKSLAISLVDVDDEMVLQLSKGLSWVHNLKKIAFQGSFTDVSFTTITQILSGLEQLNAITLKGKFGDKGLSSLSKSIHRIPSLTEVSVSGDFGNSGAIAFGKSLTSLTNLQTLTVRGGIENEGFKSILQGVLDGGTVSDLEIEGRFTSEVVTSLLFFINSHAQIRNLKINGNLNNIEEFEPLPGYLKKFLINGIQLRY